MLYHEFNAVVTFRTLIEICATFHSGSSPSGFFGILARDLERLRHQGITEGRSADFLRDFAIDHKTHFEKARPRRDAHVADKMRQAASTRFALQRSKQLRGNASPLPIGVHV